MPSLRLFLPLLLLLLPAACSVGGSPPPTPVILRSTPVPVYDFVPGVHRYVAEGYEMVIPTRTPVPTATRRPLRSVSSVTPTPAWEFPVLEVPETVWGGNVTCTREYRAMLLDYDGRIPFGAQVARELALELRDSRPECVELGWNPELSPGRVCVGDRVGAVQISRQLSPRSGSLSSGGALPTARDEDGNVLVHFARLPETGHAGCWYYDSARESWAWIVSGRDSGVDRRAFPGCDALLMDLVGSLPGDDFGAADVARAMDRVRLGAGACSSPLWDWFPSAGSHEDCGVPGDTGVSEDGSLVVTWHPDHLPADYAVCWTRPADSETWEIFYEVEDEE